MSPALLVAFALGLYLLIAKAQVSAVATAIRRGKLKSFISPENAAWLHGARVEIGDAFVLRIARAHRNDLEALLPFAIVGVLYVASGASGLSGYAYFALFTAARAAYIQPRTLERQPRCGGMPLPLRD